MGGAVDYDDSLSASRISDLDLLSWKHQAAERVSRRVVPSFPSTIQRFLYKSRVSVLEIIFATG